jgi:hypothetical protein
MMKEGPTVAARLITAGEYDNHNRIEVRQKIGIYRQTD